MRFYEIVDQVIALLRSRGRLSYRALTVEFDLNDDSLAALKEELIDIQELAIDKDGKMLVWKGGEATPPAPSSPPAQPHSPTSYTPPHLAERIRAEQAALEARGSVDGERKTITALFADLKGSTALIEGLDPEDARAIIDPAFQLMMDAVHRYEGYVAQALGDGIFALFGAPIAHEDHPQRALYAALRMQEEMRRYSDQLRLKGGTPLYLRVGINTGEVVVRSIRKDDLHTDYVPVGHSTNLAARMEQMATPGSIMVTAYTYKLTEGYFEFKALGEAQIKGVEEPLNVYEVLGAGPLRTRLQVAARRGLTRFVGRHSELEQMKQALDQAKAGHGQIVGVMGELGLGKSRLFYEFQLTSQSGCLVLEADSVSYGQASPYLPLIELLKSYFQIHPQDEDRQRKEKIAGKVLILDRSLEDTLPYLFALLGIEDPTSSLAQMDPQIRRRRTFEAIKKLFLRESLNQPLMLLFEDLHWIDSETQGFLEALSESVASARLLLLVNYRPEYRHEWGQKTYYTQLRLAPLGRDEAEEFLNILLGVPVRAVREPPLHALKQLILEKTEGTPFFMEEVIQELQEQGVLAVGATGRSPLPTALHIPTTVQGVLAARIDRLAADEKTLLQQLAVIGREFPLSLMRRVVPQSEEDLYRLLSSLQSKEFLYEQPAFPEVEYIFKHALTQEVTYGTVLQEQRKVLHERTAQAIEALFHSQLEDHYNNLAYHYTRSGNTPKAVEYLQLAGHQAVQRSANAEAIGHFTTALALLRALPETSVRAQQELTLQLALGAPLMATKGYGAPEVEKAYSRARELCRQGAETSELFPVLLGLWVVHFVRAELRLAHELGEQLLRLAHDVQDPLLLLEAHFALGQTLFCLGELIASRSHLEQGLTLYNPQQHGVHVSHYGQDVGVGCRRYEAWALWVLGYPDQALTKSREALALAQELAHPLSLGFALWCSTVIQQYCRRGQAAQERAEAAITLSAEQGFAQILAHGTILRGWALAEQGQEEEGIQQIQQGMDAWQATGAESYRPYHLALLAEAYGKTGQGEERLTALAEALTVADKTGERYYEAELYRLKGTLTLQSKQVAGKSKASRGQVEDNSENVNPQSPTPNPQSEAEACFLKAIEIARQQQAKSLELRATTSLACLWQQQGKQHEARKMLSDIYNWFTEGFDTKDLKDAKALLEELA